MLNKAHMTSICNAHMVPTTMHRTRRYVTLYILPILNVQINWIFFSSFFSFFCFSFCVVVISCFFFWGGGLFLIIFLIIKKNGGGGHIICTELKRLSMIHSSPRKAISDKGYATQPNELFTINLSQICTEFYQGRLISAALKFCICSCFFWHTILQFLILYESQTQPIPSTEIRNWTTVTARNWVQIHHLITCTVLLQLTHNANNNNG